MNWSTNINSLSPFPWATHDQYSSLPSPAVTLIAVTTFPDDLEHVVEVAVDRGDKIRMLMSTPSIDAIGNASMLMVFPDGETYRIGDRETALSWFGFYPRVGSPDMCDADGIEWFEEVGA